MSIMSKNDVDEQTGGFLDFMSDSPSQKYIDSHRRCRYTPAGILVCDYKPRLWFGDIVRSELSKSKALDSKRWYLRLRDVADPLSSDVIDSAINKIGHVIGHQIACPQEIRAALASKLREVAVLCEATLLAGDSSVDIDAYIERMHYTFISRAHTLASRMAVQGDLWLLMLGYGKVSKPLNTGAVNPSAGFALGFAPDAIRTACSDGFAPLYYKDGAEYKQIERDEAVSAALDGKYQFLCNFTPYTGERLASEIPNCNEMKVGVFDADREHLHPELCDTTKIIPNGNKNGAHYRRHPSGVECIDIVRHYNFNVGNIIKYAWRLGEKDDPIKELDKIIDYANFEKKRIQECNIKDYKATV